MLLVLGAGRVGAPKGIASNSTEMRELWGNWSETTLLSLRRIRTAGGYTWSNFNCQLDVDNGYDCPPSSLAGCGLHKTEGVPRADNFGAAPLWHPRRTGWPNGTACAEWTREACSPDSVFSKIPTMLAFGDNASLYADVAQFLLTRGKYGYMGYGTLSRRTVKSA